ncbi:hypothetical protein EYF80_042863 [Liparis tanakae]|uniref:Uncharacterized protein n=1 Tax=Liparis tanakae TaxID=230148 RepID=A0A4Z2G0B7_9TELE|nr:hypothetical protein EYF80_042863 [Liparis tanakae]
MPCCCRGTRREANAVRSEARVVFGEVGETIGALIECLRERRAHGSLEPQKFSVTPKGFDEAHGFGINWASFRGFTSRGEMQLVAEARRRARGSRMRSAGQNGSSMLSKHALECFPLKNAIKDLAARDPTDIDSKILIWLRDGARMNGPVLGGCRRLEERHMAALLFPPGLQLLRGRRSNR